MSPLTIKVTKMKKKDITFQMIEMAVILLKTLMTVLSIILMKR